MPSLFRRKSTEVAPGAADATTDADTTTGGAGRPPGQRSKAYTPGKGKVTPTRPPAQGYRAAPADRKEAAARIRAADREARAEQRARMMAGDPDALPARDRGPERALVRDIIDSRRTAGTVFFSFAFVLLLLSFGAKNMPAGYAIGSQLVWLGLAVGVVVDGWFISRRIRQLVTERYPRSTESLRGLYWYGVMRSLSYRRMRIPKPRVKVGEKI